MPINYSEHSEILDKGYLRLASTREECEELSTELEDKPQCIESIIDDEGNTIYEHGIDSRPLPRKVIDYGLEELKNFERDIRKETAKQISRSLVYGARRMI